MVWFTNTPKRLVNPTIFSQILSVPNRDLFNYFPNETFSRHNVWYYSYPLGAGFHVVPPCTQSFETL